MEFLIAGYAEINPQFVDCMSTVVVMLLLYNKKGPQKKKNGNRLLPENMLKKNRKKTRRQAIEGGVVQVGALRGQIGANGAHRGRKAKIS